jgi:hypothetical protein
MLNFNGMNTVTQGSVGLALAISYFVSKGLVVSLPLNDNQSYDLIVDMDGLKKVQVKTTRVQKNGTYMCQIKKVRPNRTGNVISNFDPTESDFIFIVTESGDKYCIPSNEIKVKTELRLNDNYIKYKQ